MYPNPDSSLDKRHPLEAASRLPMHRQNSAAIPKIRKGSCPCYKSTLSSEHQQQYSKIINTSISIFQEVCQSLKKSKLQLPASTNRQSHQPSVQDRPHFIPQPITQH
ncbi:hypothetical protein Nepgr_017966 [Nepenthes gracilis]|uniref:Uncharacterized protein n=1 Tax=Nepenthes gracilis TaxID=150966 RepID=A0AAD3XTW4_NEPGR|nr:hypothetical protein Nepgr_017966 [Nepenthes gracilis]